MGEAPPEEGADLGFAYLHHKLQRTDFACPLRSPSAGALLEAPPAKRHHLSTNPNRNPNPLLAQGVSCFTSAQWQELRRQVFIYKHLAASVPVPAELLLEPRALRPPGKPTHLDEAGAGWGLRFSAADGGDPEPGRCRRTDGKKWRCTRDAAPDQRYCEHHLNRGRPRSRKPVEQSPKKASASAAVEPPENPFLKQDGGGRCCSLGPELAEMGRRCEHRRRLPTPGGPLGEVVLQSSNAVYLSDNSGRSSPSFPVALPWVEQMTRKW